MDSSAAGFIYFLAAIGGLWLLIALIKCIWTLVRMALPRKNLQAEYGINSWAIITGGSDGIGLAFAKELAKENFNICLIARNPQKLSDVENEIRELNPQVETKVIIADFSHSQNQGFFQKIAGEARTLDIGIIVNNVGTANLAEFKNLSVSQLKEEINVNCLPPCCLTSVLLPSLLSRQSRSAVITVSSSAAKFPCPYTSNYAGTKGYGTQLSRGLQVQLEDDIDFLCIQPMVVQSNLSQQTTQRWDVITPEQCASSSLDKLGYETVTHAHWKHRLVVWLTSILPDYVVGHLAKKFVGKAVREKEKRQ